MKKEIDFAVESFHRIAFGTKKHGHKYISESKLASFVTILTDLLFKRYEKNWYPENPDRGSGYRCIRMNTQSFDPTIKESMAKASIVLPKEFQITQELTIWVDPGVVSVRIGEDGSIGSEIVDEEIYKLGKNSPSPPVTPVKRSGSVDDDDDNSSRCSSPESDRSTSSSPLLSLSTTPRFVSRSPEMEYNPYNPPARVSYPHRFQRNPSPPLNNFSSSPPLMKNPSPRAFHQLAASNQARSPLNSTRGSPVSFNSQREASHSTHGHIPGSNRTMAFNRPSRPLSSNPENISHYDGLRSYSSYANNMSYERNMPGANLIDIPAMA